LLAIAVAALAAIGVAQDAKRRSEQRLPLATLRSLRTALATAGHHGRIAPNEPTHWMQAFPDDRGETFEQFVRRNRRQLADEVSAFYVTTLQPAAGESTAAAAIVREFVAAATGLVAKELPLDLPRPVPENARGQWNALPLVSELVPTSIDVAAKLRGGPFADGAGFLAVTAHDLYFEDAVANERLNFVFGLTADRLPVVALSTARLGDPSAAGRAGQQSGRRVATLAVHEFGHALWLPHCTSFHCVMNGANDLEEADAAPLVFCPECLAKVWWRLGLEPRAHLRAMRAALQKSALAPVLAPELELLQRDLEVVEAALAPKK
jgi:archaemetzincin